jgi:SecD/SecF fusion protein
MERLPPDQRDAVRQTTRRRRHVRLASLAPVASLIVVIAVAAAFIGVRGRGQSGGSPTSVKVVVVAHPTPQVPSVTGVALSRTVEIMRARVRTVFPNAQVTSSGRSVIVIVRGHPGARAEISSLASSPRLAFYDWEANALTRNGTTVARRLQTQDPHAIEISQGSGSVAPGGPGAGSMTLYDAVTLASQQPARPGSDNACHGSEYYAFGAPGSAACAAVAKDHGTATASSPATHCLLGGPDDNKQALLHGLPRNAIVDPRPSTDAGGNPSVTFGFTATGSRAFQQLTAALARRGDLLSGQRQMFNQHFAVALDDELITVPSIDFRTYPDGISARGGADVSGDFTVAYARELAARMRLAALPLTLTPSR